MTARGSVTLSAPDGRSTGGTEPEVMGGWAHGIATRWRPQGYSGGRRGPIRGSLRRGRCACLLTRPAHRSVIPRPSRPPHEVLYTDLSDQSLSRGRRAV